MKTNNKIKNTRIFIPSNWDDLKAIQIDGKALAQNAKYVTLLKYLLHRCHTTRYLRDDGCPFSYTTAAMICKGDRKPFSKLRTALLDNGIVTCDKKYDPGFKSYQYMLGPKMENVTWTLSRQIETFNLPDYTPEDEPKELRLTIDEELLECALDYTAKQREWSDEQVACWRWQLTDNWDNDLCDSKTGRVYGTWSRVPRELRGIFLLDGEPVVEVDIKSAQPTLLVNLYGDKNEKECQLFIKIIEGGKFYEAIMKTSGIEDRNKVKEKAMAFLCGKVKGNPEILKFFERYFPILLGKIQQMNAKDYRSLARWLQKQESKIIVRQICKRFPVYSMHDGVICRKSEAKEVKKAMELALIEHCGIKGVVNIEDKCQPIEEHAAKMKKAA